MAGGSNQAVYIVKPTDENAFVDFDAIAGFVTSAYDYVALTYVPSGNGVGEIATATFKTGGSGGITVATLTLAYDASHRLSSVTKS